jgi:acyl carrier protein phosphodiesterase
MNVLAHIYLSGDSEQIIIGNYIGDYVKGREYLKYPELIRKGIILHRHIDAFTDNHPVVHEARSSSAGNITSTQVFLQI